MAHVRGVLYTTPEKTQEILDKLKEVKLPMEGKHAKGYCRPTIRIMTPLDINVYEECIPDLLDVMNANHFFMNKSAKHSNGRTHITKPLHTILRCIFTIFRWVSGHKVTERQSHKKRKMGKLTNGWWYFFYFGDRKDPLHGLDIEGEDDEDKWEAI